MSFLGAAFLWGLPLVAVPIAVHLLSRRRQEVIKWGAMQFLLDSSIRRRKIWRLDDLLLMLLRTFAIACLILALARPLWLGAGLGKGQGRDIIFVWDVSLSMARKLDDGLTLFDRQIDKSRELMDQLGASDTIRGLVTLGRGKWLSTEAVAATAENKQSLLSELQKIGVTQASADWYSCLGTAVRVTPPRSAKGRVIATIGDGQATGWRHQDQVAWQNVSRLADESKVSVAFEFHDLITSTKAPHNISLDKLTTTRTLLGVNETFLVEGQIKNYGQSTIQDVTVTWELDGASLGKATVGPFPPGQSRQVSIKHTMTKAGISTLNCRIDLNDDLDADNARSLILETIDRVPLLLVDDSLDDDPLKSEKGYLLAAIGQDPHSEDQAQRSSAFHATVIPSNELASQSLSEYRAVILANMTFVNDSLVTKLSEFVKSGGGLWIVLGDRTVSADFNRQFHRSGGGLVPWPIDEAKGDLIQREQFLTVHPPEDNHPATILLSDTQRLDMDRVKIFQRFPFRPLTANADVPILLQTGSGEALAIESAIGKGRVFTQSLTLSVRWSNLPLTQAFVPLVHEWMWYLIQPTAISRNLLPGEPLQIAMPANEHVREIQIDRPGVPPLIITPSDREDRTIVRNRETLVPGPYEITIRAEGKDEEHQSYQVMRAAEESDLTPLPLAFLKGLEQYPNFRANPTKPLSMPTAGVAKRPQGEPIWATLLMLVIVALLIEIGLVRWMAGRRFASGSNPIPAGSLATGMLGKQLGMRGTE